MTQNQTYITSSEAEAIPVIVSGQGWTWKEKLLLGVAGVAVLTGGIWFGKKAIEKIISNREEKKTFDEGSSATYAKQIKMAFENDGWPGTDTDLLRRVLIEIPSKQAFSAVSKSYRKLYQSNILTEMSSELQSTQYNEMLQIVASKPEKAGQAVNHDKQYEAWAKRLKAAFDKTYGFMPGTDEEAIKAVFTEIPTLRAFASTAVMYKKLYGSELLTDLKSELEMWEYNDYMSIIYKKPKG